MKFSIFIFPTNTMSYPVYIPVYMPGGGGGGGGKKDLFVFIGSSIVVFCGFALGMDTLLVKPKYDLRLIKHRAASFHTNKHPWMIQVERYNGFPEEEIINIRNMDCLIKKGYELLIDDRNCSKLRANSWNSIVKIRPPADNNEFISIEQILADCKECGTYVEARYEYKDVFGYRRRGDSKMDWHKSYCKTLVDIAYEDHLK